MGSSLDGLITFTEGKQGYKYYHHEVNGLPSISGNKIVSLMEDSRGRIWVGMYEGNINIIDEVTGKIICIENRNYPDSAIFRTYSFFEDPEHTIWACTDNGLKKYDEKTGGFITLKNDPRNPESLNGHIAYCIAEDKPGHYWVGTDNGLNEFDSRQNIFTLYTTTEGLCNDHITNMVYARRKLVLGTENGLSVFDPEVKKFTNFFKEDGLEKNDITEGFDLGANDVLYIGGTGSVSAIDLKTLVKQEVPTPAILTNLTVFDKDVHFDIPYEKIKQVKLDYRQNYLTFSFTAPDFINEGKTKFYVCKMEGLYNDWVDNGTNSLLPIQTWTAENIFSG